MELFIPSHNCCDVNVCHESCFVLGHPTILGFIIIFLITLLIGFFIFYLNAYSEIYKKKRK